MKRFTETIVFVGSSVWCACAAYPTSILPSAG
jgi:hypothetical protein